MHAHHALVLNLHQPPGNLEQLLSEQSWEAKEILFALDRMPRSLWGQEDLARVHLSLSGTLLETLSSPDFQARVYGIVDCGKLLWFLQNQRLFEVLGTGYYHPVLPLIPAADRPEHLRRWQGIARHLFWRSRFEGFWPPEMGFAMELIPLLRRFGYRYVLVDSEHIEPVDAMSWQALRYRPHIARYGGDEIIVVVRDRELSDAQESGMDVDWFVNEVAERTRWCDFPPLVTTATDGENGGWFRNVTAGANYWSAFYLPLLERIRAGDAELRPTFIHDYLNTYGARGEVRVATGAWNTGWHHGTGFTQWTGSKTQREVIARYGDVSARLHQWLERLEQAERAASAAESTAVPQPGRIAIESDGNEAAGAIDAEGSTQPNADRSLADGHASDGSPTASVSAERALPADKRSAYTAAASRIPSPDASVGDAAQTVPELPDAEADAGVAAAAVAASGAEKSGDREAGTAEVLDRPLPESLEPRLEDAHWHLLRAETSCNIFWGEAWCHRADADLGRAEGVLNQLDADLMRNPRPPSSQSSKARD